jgi:GNAT superfamily N-acetyltransferase
VVEERPQTAVASVGHIFLLSERSHWYELDLNWLERVVERRLREFPGGYELVPATEDELPLLEALPGARSSDALLRHRRGATLWLLLHEGLPALACWTAAGRTALHEAAPGSLELPAGVVAVEDMIIAPTHRRRGLAPRALMRIGDFYAPRGVRALVARVAEVNAPLRHAFEKAGFDEVAQTRLVRVGPLKRMRVEWTETETSSWLPRALGGERVPAPGGDEPTPVLRPSAPRRPRTPQRAGRSR